MSAPLSLQNIPPKWAHFCLGVERFLLDEPGHPSLNGVRLAVSFSAGADSTALLLAMHCLAPRLGCGLLAVHCDHAIRPDSAKDAIFAADFCRNLGAPIITERIDVPSLARELNVGLEEAGRDARRALLQRVMADADCSFALTGHQLDDLAEDQLMRALRGAGWPALGGMASFLPQERILRPLLLTPKAMLREFLQDLGVMWREDPSNQDRSFLRNRVRAMLLPAMVAENPNYLETAAELWRQARSDAAHFETLCRRIVSKIEAMDEESFLLPASALNGSDEAVRLRVFKACLERLGPGQPLASSLRSLDRAWLDRRLGAAVQFPGGKSVRVERIGLVFHRPT